MIAVVLFLVSDFWRLLPDRISFDLAVCKGLVAMVGLNVVGLRSVLFLVPQVSPTQVIHSFSNFTLKYIDASFYQVARGLLLPFTVTTSYVFLHTRPSLFIILACSVVTVGFFIGVFLDGTVVSMTGISFGVASSVITALHSVVIKQSLNVVNGSALLLSWYTNLLSAVVLAPIILFAGEVPAILKLLFGLDELVQPDDGFSPLTTFIWGSMITVRLYELRYSDQKLILCQGLFGFLMSIASLLSIKVTSPITHMISSAVRGVAASLLSVWLFHDIITTYVPVPPLLLSTFNGSSSGRASSIAIILLGSIWYTWIKHQESSRSANGSSQGAYERVKLEKLESGDSNAIAHKEEKPE